MDSKNHTLVSSSSPAARLGAPSPAGSPLAQVDERPTCNHAHAAPLDQYDIRQTSTLAAMSCIIISRWSILSRKCLRKSSITDPSNPSYVSSFSTVDCSRLSTDLTARFRPPLFRFPGSHGPDDDDNGNGDDALSASAATRGGITGFRRRGGVNICIVVVRAQYLPSSLSLFRKRRTR